MWWPSFLSVLQDLWFFLLRSESPVEVIRSSQSVPLVQTGVSGVTTPPNSPPRIQLAAHVRYTAEHPATKEIRSYLTTETTIKVSQSDLTAYEWLAYLYTTMRRPLPWNTLALSPIGFWHQALKGLTHITISLIPKTNSLMEWQDEVHHGHVGYVTKVTPGETVTVQELGASLPGVLSEMTVPEIEWRELRPVFISVA